MIGLRLLVGAIPILSIPPTTAYKCQARVLPAFHFTKAIPISITQSVCFFLPNKLCSYVKFAKFAILQSIQECFIPSQRHSLHFIPSLHLLPTNAKHSRTPFKIIMPWVIPRFRKRYSLFFSGHITPDGIEICISIRNNSDEIIWAKRNKKGSKNRAARSTPTLLKSQKTTA